MEKFCKEIWVGSIQSNLLRIVLLLSSSKPRRRQWHLTPVLLPGKSHGRRSLVGCSLMGSLRVGHNWATSLWLKFSLSCNGEGNGNPLQCSCLENPRDGGAWWAAIYGVAQSRTRLKWLSSGSSSKPRKLQVVEARNVGIFPVDQMWATQEWGKAWDLVCRALRSRGNLRKRKHHSPVLSTL